MMKDAVLSLMMSQRKSGVSVGISKFELEIDFGSLLVLFPFLM